MNYKLETLELIVNLIRNVIQTFYSDLHIIIMNVLLKSEYASEYAISKKISIDVEKIRLITNSLYNDYFVRFEDRLFKQVKTQNTDRKRKPNKKVYKIRYWYVDYDSIIWSIKQKIKNIFSLNINKTPNEIGIRFKCPRKVCGRRYSVTEITGLPFNKESGNFICNEFLNLKIICGSELQEELNVNVSGEKKKSYPG